MNDSKIGRCWGNKLNHVNDLLSWMFVQDILTKTEKAEKDRLFNSYYRFYNDGVIPRGVGGCNEYEIRVHLELKVNTFIAKTLLKKQGKYSRKEFRGNQLRTNLTHLITLADEFELHMLFTFFSERYKIGGMHSYDFFYMGELNEEYNSLSQEVNTLIDVTVWDGVDSWNHPTGKTINYQLEMLEKQNALTEEVSDKVLSLKLKLVDLSAEIKKEMINRNL